MGFDAECMVLKNLRFSEVQYRLCNLLNLFDGGMSTCRIRPDMFKTLPCYAVMLTSKMITACLCR